MGRRAFEVILPCPECGVDFVHITFSGHRHELCPVCRKPLCTACGTRVPVERGYKRTCSDDCQKVIDATNNKTKLANKLKKNPDHYKEANVRYAAKVNADPVKRALYLQKEAERYQKRKNDPEYKAIIAKARAKYRASEHGKRTENRYRAIYRENVGEFEYLSRRRESEIRRSSRLFQLQESNPLAYAKYLQKQREYARKWRQRNRLSDLQAQFQSLVKKVNND